MRKNHGSIVITLARVVLTGKRTKRPQVIHSHCNVHSHHNGNNSFDCFFILGRNFVSYSDPYTKPFKIIAYYPQFDEELDRINGQVDTINRGATSQVRP